VNVFVAFLLACCMTHALAAEPEIVTDMAFIKPARLVDIGAGRRMNIYCIGRGSPTVIFESGLGDQVRAWAMVQPAVGKFTRACSYDRAGLGFSYPSGREGTSENAVDDLHRLLVAAAINPPYVLVGHSLGGMYVRLYADHHGSEVSGMVLVDPMSEEQGRRDAELDPKTPAAIEDFVKTIRNECIPAAIKGFEAGTELMKKCVGEPDRHFSNAFNTAFLVSISTPDRQQAVWSEWVNVFRRSSDQVRAAKRSYGDMPLIVLTNGGPRPKGPNETQEMSDAKRQLWIELHDELARLSSKGVDRVVPGSRHYIQFDRPNAVIEAIREIVRSIQRT